MAFGVQGVNPQESHADSASGLEIKREFTTLKMKADHKEKLKEIHYNEGAPRSVCFMIYYISYHT